MNLPGRDRLASPFEYHWNNNFGAWWENCDRLTVFDRDREGINESEDKVGRELACNESISTFDLVSQAHEMNTENVTDNFGVSNLIFLHYIDNRDTLKKNITSMLRLRAGSAFLQRRKSRSIS